MSDEEMKDPSFIVIGPGRTGSSWMYEMLLQHPDVCMARNTKETLFFNQAYEKGLDRYYRFFQHCREDQAIGEISTTYFHDPKVPERIHRHFPHVRLITCLRDPMERTVSAYSYRIRAGETVVSFEEALKQEPDLLEESLYDRQLERFMGFFPKERIHVLFYDELQKDPLYFLRQLYQAVGVDGEFVPEGVKERINERSAERIPGTGKLLGWGATTLRRLGAYGILDRIKRSKSVRALFLKEKEKGSAPPLSDDTRRWLDEKFRTVTEWVEAFTGRDLEHWKKD